MKENAKCTQLFYSRKDEISNKFYVYKRLYWTLVPPWLPCKPIHLYSCLSFGKLPRKRSHSVDVLLHGLSSKNWPLLLYRLLPWGFPSHFLSLGHTLPSFPKCATDFHTALLSYSLLEVFFLTGRMDNIPDPAFCRVLQTFVSYHPLPKVKVLVKWTAFFSNTSFIILNT